MHLLITNHFIANQIEFQSSMQYKKIVYFLLSFFCTNVMKMIALCIHKYFSLNVFFIVSYLYFSCYMKKYLDMISFSCRLNDSIFVIKYCKSYATICNNCLYRIHAKTKQFVFSPVSQLTPM